MTQADAEQLVNECIRHGGFRHGHWVGFCPHHAAQFTARSRPAPPDDLVAPAVGSPFPLEHSPTCGDPYDPDARCTCGLSWRIRLVTEQEHRAAWQKRAEEAEAREVAAPASVAAPAPAKEEDTCPSDCPGCMDCDPVGTYRPAPAPETPIRHGYGCPCDGEDMRRSHGRQLHGRRHHGRTDMTTATTPMSDHEATLRVMSEAEVLWRRYLRALDDARSADSVWTCEAALLVALELEAEARVLVGDLPDVPR